MRGKERKRGNEKNTGAQRKSIWGSNSQKRKKQETEAIEIQLEERGLSWKPHLITKTGRLLLYHRSDSRAS